MEFIPPPPELKEEVDPVMMRIQAFYKKILEPNNQMGAEWLRAKGIELVIEPPEAGGEVATVVKVTDLARQGPRDRSTNTRGNQNR